MGKSAIPVGNANFEIACNYLGWGDPEGGVWFIGPEESQEFDEAVIRDMRGKRFSYVESEGQDESPFRVKTRVLKIISMLNGDRTTDDTAKYLWKKGSRIFNGNLLPLGKKSLNDWPDIYRDLSELIASNTSPIGGTS